MNWNDIGKPLWRQRHSLIKLELHTEPVELEQGPLAPLRGIGAHDLREAISKMEKLRDLNLSASLVQGSVPYDPPYLPDMFPKRLERLTLHENLDRAGPTYQAQAQSRLAFVESLLNDSSFEELECVTTSDYLALDPAAVEKHRWLVEPMADDGYQEFYRNR